MFAQRIFIIAFVLLIKRLLLLGFGAVVAFLIIIWWKGHLDIPCYRRRKVSASSVAAFAI
jgi:hypothetical protein